jgi:hypothetical protein
MAPKRKPARSSNKVRSTPRRSRAQSRPGGPIPAADLPLEQGLREMATIGAQSVLWVTLAAAAVAALAFAAFIVWSLRPLPVYLSERVKTGSPFDVEFWMENSSPWFAMPRLSISCVLTYPGAPDLPATKASELRLPGNPTALGPGEMATFKCPFAAALRGAPADELGLATRAEIYFRSQYDAPLIGSFRLTDHRGPFVLNTKLLPPRWMGREER